MPIRSEIARRDHRGLRGERRRGASAATGTPGQGTRLRHADDRAELHGRAECRSDLKSLVVITAGYAESGVEGQARQQALLDKVRGYGMRMIGPNCMGVLNADQI